MAQVLPAKRPRAPTGGIDPTSSGITGIRSRDKRPRHFPPQDSERIFSETQSITSNDDSVADEEITGNEDASFVWATQQVQKDFLASANRRNIPADAGIIEEIQCINFMCHEHLTVPLGPLINFIIGHNGSGKSAVLTALTLCLGGKATATNRGQNLKSFIKEGKDHSILQVKIKNRGSLAYKPQHYGDSIIVERHFSRAGTSGFKLKDRNGRIVSNKKAELEDIIDAFSMQIDNPMNVLTQDMARQFLNDSSPKDKYKFFLKGTQLETLSRDYAQIHQSLEEQNSKAEFKKNDLDVYRKRMEDLAAKARRAENLEKMRRKETDIIHQAAWAHVEEYEKELADADLAIEEVSRTIEERNAQANEASDNYERANEALQNAEQAVTELETEKEPAEQNVDECRSQWQESKDKLLTMKTTERELAQEVQQKGKAVKDAEAIIAEHKQRQEGADNGLYAELLRKFEEAKARKEQTVHAFETHDDSLPDLEKNVTGARVKKTMADENLRKAQAKESQSKNRINELQGGHRRWIDSYQNPGSLAKLLSAIENDKRFREQPVGPMGRHVKLLKPEWASILEKQFGRALDAFVVTSKADQMTLSELMRKCNWNSPIYIGKKDRIDTSQHEPNRNLLTWMRALKIENDLVRNQCIINQSIDQTVLIESRAEGQDFMHNGGPDTRNVKMCFTMADNSKRRGHFVQVTPSGGHNIGPIGEYQGNLRMQADKDDQIRQEQIHLEHIRQEIRDLHRTCNGFQNQVDDCEAKIRDHGRTKRRLNIERQAAAEAVDRLDDELVAAAPDAAGNEQREGLLTEAKEKLRFCQEQYQDMIEERNKLNNECRSNKNALDAAIQSLEEIEHRLNKAAVKIKTLASRREEALRAKNLALQAVSDAEENKKEWEEKREQEAQQVQTSTAEAQTVCDRVEVPAGQTPESLLKMIEKLHKQRLETEKQLGGSQDELLRQANEARRVHMKAHEEFKEITRLRNALATTLDNRQARWKRFRSDISVRARVTFNYLLSERKFRGTLSIDHKAQALDIQVQPDITERSEAGRQAKTLSGGEKSFSTICLLLALWDAMGSPIRCLDEFDVFMDNVNREISMGMMIQAARRSIGRQYILITPQAMGNVKKEDDVHIIRMSDPERGQTTLNFGRS